MKYIPYGRQFIDRSDVKEVSKALVQDFITTGNYVKKFEDKVSSFLRVKYALSCINGTAALHLAFMAINLKKNDVVIMPAVNFVASYSMAKFMNAKIYLADVDSLTGQMTPRTLLDCINKNKIKKIKAVVTMHLGGYPENVIEFFKIKKKYKFYLIEDACHALGAKYFYNKKYIPIGSCKHSDISTFSLHPVKTITSGEGGIVTTNSTLIYDQIILLRSHGIEKDKNFHWKYNILRPSFNYRLSDLNCALALSQLKKIKKFINYRKRIYDFYRSHLKINQNFINIKKYSKIIPSFHLYLLSIKFKKKKKKKNELLKFLKKKNIYCQFHYIPIYKFKLFKDKIDLKYFQGSENYFQNNISLPIFFNLKFFLLKKIIKKINTFIKT